VTDYLQNKRGGEAPAVEDLGTEVDDPGAEV
jgi:hypothetical protein